LKYGKTVSSRSFLVSKKWQKWVPQGMSPTRAMPVLRRGRLISIAILLAGGRPGRV